MDDVESAVLLALASAPEDASSRDVYLRLDASAIGGPLTEHDVEKNLRSLASSGLVKGIGIGGGPTGSLTQFWTITNEGRAMVEPS